MVSGAPAPVVGNPYLSILINRRDLGSSFDLGVDKANTNLVVTGENTISEIQIIGHQRSDKMFS